MVDEVILNIVYHQKNIVEVILILNYVPEKRKKIICNKFFSKNNEKKLSKALYTLESNS